MSNIDKRALREAAEKAGADEWCAFIDTKSKTYAVHTPADNRCGDVVKWAGFDGQQRAATKAKFIAAANPATMAALLDELEAKDKQIADLKEAFTIALSAAGIDAPAAAGGEVVTSNPIHYWLMLLKPGEYMTFPPAFARLSSETIDFYARRSGRELNRRYRIIRGEGGRKSRGPVTVIYVR